MNKAEGSQTWEGEGNRTKEPYHFSTEELRVLKECNRESFYQRSLPLATVFGLGTFYAVKSGYLKSSSRFGATPKIFLSLIAGYFLGKLSYQKTCAEKMMQLPNSPLGEMLRKRRQHAGGSPSFSESFGLETSLPTPSVSTPTAKETFEAYAEHGARSMDLDITQPLHGNLEIGTLPAGDAFLMEEEPLPAAQSNTTYDELRRQNREEYDKRRSRGLPGLDDPSVRGRAPTSTAPPSSSSSDQNQYGDTWIR